LAFEKLGSCFGFSRQIHLTTANVSSRTRHVGVGFFSYLRLRMSSLGRPGRLGLQKGGTMSSRRLRFVLPAALVLGLVGASLAIAAGKDHGKSGNNQFTAKLIGHNETPAVHTAGRGTLVLTVNANNTLSYTLTYSGLNTAAGFAHVHFGQPDVAGGVSFFLCGGGSKPACPAGTSSTATVSGTVAPSDVLALPTQGLAAGDLAAIVAEIKAGFTYANVHTATSPAGEIRGQLGGQEDDDD
jgi:hypothetical protein